VNERDSTAGRKVWFQYWDSHLSFEKSYFARLRYVHENAVHHGLVSVASNYPWCSAGWFERCAEASFRKTIMSLPCNTINVLDDFEVSPDFLASK
jgi:putative transposase